MSFVSLKKAFGALEKISNSLKNEKKKPKAGKMSFFWRKIKIKTKNQSHPKIKLVTSQYGNGNARKVTGIYVGDEFLSIKEAQEKALNDKNSYLALVVNALAFGDYERNKATTGDKIGSKLYVDNERNFSIKRFGKKIRLGTVAKDNETIIPSVNKTFDEKTSSLTFNSNSIISDGGKLDILKLRSAHKKIDSLKQQLAEMDLSHLAEQYIEEFEQKIKPLKEKTDVFDSLYKQIEQRNSEINSLLSLPSGDLANLANSDYKITLDELDKLSEKIVDPEDQERNFNDKIDGVKNDFIKVSDKEKLKASFETSEPYKTNAKIAREEMKNIIEAYKNAIRIKSEEVDIKFLKSFFENYKTAHDNLTDILKLEGISDEEKTAFIRLNQNLSENLVEFAAKYSEKVQNLDYETNNPEEPSLSSEKVFLDNISKVIPQLTKAEAEVKRLADFAEKTDLTEPNQMSKLSLQTKQKILKQYFDGHFVTQEALTANSAFGNQAFFGNNFIQRLGEKIPIKDGTKIMDGMVQIFDEAFSGDYDMARLMVSNFHDTNDRSAEYLETQLLDFLNSSVDAMQEKNSEKKRQLKELNLLKSKLNIVKNDIVPSLEMNSLNSIKLSESLKAFKASSDKQDLKSIDLIILYAQLTEIKIDALNESIIENHSLDQQKKLFEKKIKEFIDTHQDEFSFDQEDLNHLGMNANLRDNHQIIAELALQGFSSFDEVDKSLKTLSVFAKKFGQDPKIMSALKKNFIKKDSDILSLEIQKTSMSKLLGLNVADNMMENLIKNLSRENLQDIQAFSNISEAKKEIIRVSNITDDPVSFAKEKDKLFKRLEASSKLLSGKIFGSGLGHDFEKSKTKNKLIELDREKTTQLEVKIIFDRKFQKSSEGKSKVTLIDKYAEAGADKGLKIRSTEVAGQKAGRFISNMGKGSIKVFVDTESGKEEKTLTKVRDVLNVLRKNHDKIQAGHQERVFDESELSTKSLEGFLAEYSQDQARAFTSLEDIKQAVDELTRLKNEKKEVSTLSEEKKNDKINKLFIRLNNPKSKSFLAERNVFGMGLGHDFEKSKTKEKLAALDLDKTNSLVDAVSDVREVREFNSLDEIKAAIKEVTKLEGPTRSAKTEKLFAKLNSPKAKALLAKKNAFGFGLGHNFETSKTKKKLEQLDLDKANLLTNAIIAERRSPTNQNETSEETPLSDDAQNFTELKDGLAKEEELLDAIGGNIKDSIQMIHMGICNVYNAEKANYPELTMQEFATKLATNEGSLKEKVKKKFKVPEHLNILIDITARKLSSLSDQNLTQTMVSWYDDVHLDERTLNLQIDIDKQNARVGGANSFSHMKEIFNAMNSSDEFKIAKSGSLQLKSSAGLNIAQEALSAGSLELEASAKLSVEDGMLIRKEANEGFSLLFDHAMGAELGIGSSAAMGALNLGVSAGGSISSGYKLHFKDSATLEQFLSKIFIDPTMVVADLTRAETIYLNNGSEIRGAVEGTAGLPSIISQLAVYSGISDGPKSDHEEAVFDKVNEIFSVGAKGELKSKSELNTNRFENIQVNTYSRSHDFKGGKLTEGLLKSAEVKNSTLHSKYVERNEIRENKILGMITSCVTSREMTVESEDENISVKQKAYESLEKLAPELTHNDEIKAKFLAAVENFDKENGNPTIAIETKVTDRAFQDIYAKSHEIMKEPQISEKEKKSKISKMAETVMKDPKNILVTNISLKSNKTRPVNRKLQAVKAAELASKTTVARKVKLGEGDKKQVGELKEVSISSSTTNSQKISQQKSVQIAVNKTQFDLNNSRGSNTLQLGSHVASLTSGQHGRGVGG